MSRRPHLLEDEIPEHADLIRRLREEDPHFARLAERWRELSVRIHEAEVNLDPSDDDLAESLKRERVRVMDEIWAILRRHLEQGQG